jgi:HK97 gp10 family phage protein
MASRVTIEGLEEIQEAFSKISIGKNAIIDKALRVGIEPIQKEMSRRVPKGKGAGGYKGAGHLKDNIAISNVENENGTRAIYAGVKKGDNSNWFYAKFLEWGTSKMSARPFMQPSYNAKKNQAFKLMCESVKGDLKL